MNARCIAEHLAERIVQFTKHGRMHRRGSVVVQIDSHQFTSLAGNLMKSTALIAVLTFALTVPKPPEAPKAENDNSKADPGIRKLSRRERKERIKNLPDHYRQFLTDVDP